MCAAQATCGNDYSGHLTLGVAFLRLTFDVWVCIHDDCMSYANLTNCHPNETPLSIGKVCRWVIRPAASGRLTRPKAQLHLALSTLSRLIFFAFLFFDCLLLHTNLAKG